MLIQVGGGILNREGTIRIFSVHQAHALSIYTLKWPRTFALLHLLILTHIHQVSARNCILSFQPYSCSLFCFKLSLSHVLISNHFSCCSFEPLLCIQNRDGVTITDESEGAFVRSLIVFQCHLQMFSFHSKCSCSK